jgi:hypothetical protein
MRIIIISILVSLLSCQSKPKQTEEEQKVKKVEEHVPNLDSVSTPISKGSAPISFLDSISGKLDLTIQQIQKYSIIDSMFYTGRFSNASFVGDTVFNFSNSYKGAIIEYDDRQNCIHKFLLIFSPIENQNTDYKRIYSDCDRDPSADYITLSYKILKDSTFQTIESYIPANTDKIAQIEKIKWHINNRGLVDSTRKAKNL